MKKSPHRYLLAAALLLVLPVPALAAGLLHSFTPDGGGPNGALVSDGAGNLYGTTSAGGRFGGGVLFKVRTDGSGYTILHEFGDGSDGNAPVAAVVLDGTGWIFGTTRQAVGGVGSGTVFTLRTDGTSYSRLHSFTGGADGGDPQGALVLDGAGNLYGTTSTGGASGQGTLFTLTAAGTGFTTLHDFAGGASDGASPIGLSRDGGQLYGVTFSGGSAGMGTLYSVSTAGSGFTILHSFTGGTDGANPYGAPATDFAGNFFGTTLMGGATGGGTVWRIDSGGGSYSVLHSFSASEGTNPGAAVTLDLLGNLYGTAIYGGAGGSGSVYSMATDGAGFAVLHSFVGFGSDGRYPFASLFFDSAGTLYGSTSSGPGTLTGSLFRIHTVGSGFMQLHLFDTSDGAGPTSSLVSDGAGNLYGTTDGGGPSGVGTVFTVRTDGTNYAVLHAFDGSDGRRPLAGLLLQGTTLYGTTNGPGSGTVFRVNVDGSGFTTIHSFTGADGSGPYGRLATDGAGVLYGTCWNGGAAARGTVYKLRTDSSDFQVIHSFAGPPADGSYPLSGVVRDATGNLWGVTSGGGTTDWGAVYLLTPDGSSFWILHSFDRADGSYPFCELVSDDQITFYGTASHGGTWDRGTAFSVTVSSFFVLHVFGDGTDGRSPQKGLVSDGTGWLYGTTAEGGTTGKGSVFELKSDGTSYLTVHSFEGALWDGDRPEGALLLIGPDLYGTTVTGGSGNDGAVFRLPRTGGCAVTATMGGSGALCAGQSAIVQASLTGSGPWNVTWSDGYYQPGIVSSPVSRTVSPTITTSYRIGLVTSGTCAGTATGEKTITVVPTPATPAPTSNSPVCAGADLKLETAQTPGATYEWQGPGGFTSATPDPTIPGVTSAAAGTYTVRITLDGCASGWGSTEVVVQPDATPPAVTPPAALTADQTVCCGTFGGARSSSSADLATFLAGGTAVDDCDPSPVRWTPQISGVDVTPDTCFEAGATLVDFPYLDSSGKLGSAAASVTVRMFGDLNLDLTVDPSDMVVLRAYFNFAITPGTSPFTAPLGMADLTHDATVDPSDMVMLRSYFNFAVSCLAP